MSTETLSYRDMVEQLPPDSHLVLRGLSWEEYEALLQTFVEAKGLRLSYDEGRLEIMVLSAEHENYAELIKQLVGTLSLRLRIKVLHFGSATMRKKGQSKGAEADACFYVQSADAIGNRKQIDFSSDPPPDIVVEVDLHHESIAKFPIYAALGVQEIWRYDGQTLGIYHLEKAEYVGSDASVAFPMLTASRLTELLNRSQEENQYEILLAFDSWLKALGT
ncbi:MAG: Uma2 family endonuclease [Acidobacteria bacterium]|nr:MAG: Uma2 family endonuclease [Acidobacteriota bacterium]